MIATGKHTFDWPCARLTMGREPARKYNLHPAQRGYSRTGRGRTF